MYWGICSCVQGIDWREVEALPRRDDTSIIRQVQRSHRTTAKIMIGASIPMFLLGVADLTRVLPINGLMFLVGGPAALAFGIVLLVGAQTA